MSLGLVFFVFLDITPKVISKMDYSYLVVPFLSWFVAGICKFIINSLRSRQAAFDQIGYGGMPSNHSAIISSIAALIALKEGVNNPLFGLAIANAFIIMLDANSLRVSVGRHAAAINKLTYGKLDLRERMGHSKTEIVAGIFIGCSVAFLLNSLYI
jgi:acid phosphatase family membrane protein YuiD